MRRRASARIALLALGWVPLAVAAAAPPLQPCRVPGLKNEVQCGRLMRALDPARPHGPQIEVHYVVVPATARRKHPDPVVLLAGGPGQSAIDVAPLTLGRLARLSNRRDLVFVDLRGTGRSAPLDCEADEGSLPRVEFIDPQAQARRVDACRARLVGLPHVPTTGDLAFYTTTLAMQDLDAVRTQLGVAQWNLVGGSYGTRAALEYMRQFPQAVRRVVLDGVAPPDMVLPASASPDAQAVFDALFDACAAEPACRQAYPDLRGDWNGLVAGLPRTVSVDDPVSGRRETITLTREMLLGAVRGPLYLPALAAGLPAAITAAARGRLEPLLGLASQGSRRAGRIAVGLHFAVSCAEDVPRLAATPDAPGPTFGDGLARLYRQVCAGWPRADVPEAFYTVPAFPRAALLLSGGADPATPPRHAERVARALGPRARHVVVPQAGHGILALPCMHDVLFRFVDAADDAAAGAMDADCARGVPRPPAFVPPAVPAGSLP